MTKKHQSKAPAPAKVQQTLSSFFKPKSTEPAAPATTAPRSTTTKRRVPLRTDDDNDDNDHHSDVPNTKSHATKRPLSPDTRSFGSSAPLSPSKRTRSDSDGVSSFFGAPAPETPKTPKTETKMTQFVFSPQKANDSAAADARLEEKRQRHDQFVAKFGDPNGSTLANKRRAPKILEDEEDEEGAEGGENEEGAEAGKNEDDDDADNMDVDDDERLVRTFKKLRSDYSAPTKATAVATALSSTKKRSVGRASKADQNKYTPLEKQYMEIKAQYPDTLLVVEVGYKFKFFDEDARIASKILHIAHFTDHNFHVASIPTHRLSVHVRRLVHAGHKVGVVRQTETAALKAAGDNRSAPFTRCLTNLYTKGTFVEDMVNSEVDEDKSGAGIGDSNYLMCVVEEKRGGSGSDERVKLGIVAVQPSTGDIVYDSFDDGYMRSELETRVLHIQPCEMLLPEQLSKSTEKLVSHLALHRTTAFGDAVRIERMPEAFLSYNDAFTYVSNFYAKNTAKAAEEMKEGAPKEKTLFAEILRFPENVIICLAAMIHYLTDFGLEHVLQLTKYFAPFSSRSHMLLNGNTLANLEIYRNQTNYAERGSLLWVLDHTSTSFGRRLLRRWVGRPLIDVDQLNERVNAVEEILNNDSPLLQKARELLKQLPDLERGLCRIHYGKSSSTELLQILMALQRIADSFPHGSTGSAFTSPLLEGIFVLLPTVREDVMRYMDAIDLKAAEAEDKFNLFKDNGKYPDIKKHKDRIASVEIELQNHLKEVRKVLNKPSLMYVDVSQIEYLIEVKNTETAKVPKNWIKISGTKQVSRFHTPTVLKILRERDQHKERLRMACDHAYSSFLSEMSEQYELFRDLVQQLAVLDCLFSLTAVACQPGYIKPEFVADRTQIKVISGRHPMVEQILTGPFVPNDVDFNAEDRRTMILTGPNMGGKSSYIRQVALLSIMGQIGSYVPAESAKLGILDAVFTRMGAFDNMLAGESTFMVELHETSDIMKQATQRSLVILDELGRGTSTHDGVAIAYAVLKHFITQIKSITLFVTHYPSLAELANEFSESTVNCHMGFLESEDDDASQTVTFLYKLTQGVAMRSYGLNVARLASLPKRVLNTASVKSAEMEKVFTEKQRSKRTAQLREVTRRWLSGGLETKPANEITVLVQFLKSMAATTSLVDAQDIEMAMA